MKTNHEHFSYENQRGNALIYVLIAIALFAALSMTLGRQTDSSQSDDLSYDKAQLYATQLISYAAQAKSATDQMTFSRTAMDDFDFTRPGEGGYEAGTLIQKTKRIYHPDGGGLSVGAIPAEATTTESISPTPGWYMGRFNNVDWTKTPAHELILVAYGIRKKVCERINDKILGNTSIPDLIGVQPEDVFIDEDYHLGSNVAFITDPVAVSPACAECHKRTSLCVHGTDQNVYSFFTILQHR